MQSAFRATTSLSVLFFINKKKITLVIDWCVFVCYCMSEQPEIFFSVMSESTWSEVLTDSQRQHLRQLLPHFPENNSSEQDRVISDLFNDQNFFFGNPLHIAQKLFRGTFYFPLSKLLLYTSFFI